MFKTLLEQWKANQEQKRKIAAERWEQEKQWREEDRAAELQKKEEADKRRLQEQEEEEKKKQERQELYNWLYRKHLDAQHKAGTVSYIDLVCHEDTWTYIARRAFGMWEPGWVTSQKGTGGDGPGTADGAFTKDPNLVEGRISKQSDGMQTVQVSGDNLVTILDVLYEHQWGVKGVYDEAKSAGWPLYKRIEGFLEELDSASVAEPGHKLVIDQRINGSDTAD
ncbi:hypothetical protein ACWGLG_34290 [Streptomyces antimycoticus]